MNLKKIKAVVCAAVCGVATAVLPFVQQKEDAEIFADSTVKIMGVGDSITNGYGTDGSYRKFLYKNLTDKGYSIDMVGPEWNWGDASYTDEETGETFTYDPAHCGYSGYSTVNFPGRNGIMETLQSNNALSTYNPDIVILQIGTNDVIDNYEIDKAGDRLTQVVSYILSNISSSSALFVTTIPDLDPNRSDVYSWFGNYRHSSDWQTQYSDEQAEKWVHENVASYNKQVKQVVEAKQAAGVKNIYYGDVNSAITDVKTQLKDGVHPNNKGYKLMGNYWTNIVDSYLSGETQPATDPTPAVTTTTTPEVTTTTTTTTMTTTTTTEVTTTTSATTTTAETTTVTTAPVTEETTTQPIQHEHIVGDVNDDGVCDIRDVVLLSKQLLCLEPVTWYGDITSDGRINVFDLIMLKRAVFYGFEL